MLIKNSSTQSTFLDALSSLWTQLHAGLLIPLDSKECNAPHRASDFEGWLRRDPSVIRNRGNRYYERPINDISRDNT